MVKVTESFDVAPVAVTSHTVPAWAASHCQRIGRSPLASAWP